MNIALLRVAAIADTLLLNTRITRTVNEEVLTRNAANMFGTGHPFIADARHYRDCYVTCRNARNARRHNSCNVDTDAAYWYAAS
jgi:hypothetical protein